MEDDPSLVRAARRAGALGYVLKESADADLVEAVRRAAAGEPYLNRRLAARPIAQRAEEGWD
jgi:two-component system response regulator NreC